MKILKFETDVEFLAFQRNNRSLSIYSISNADNTKHICDVEENDIIKLVEKGKIIDRCSTMLTDNQLNRLKGNYSDYFLSDDKHIKKVLKKALIINIADKIKLTDYLEEKILKKCKKIYAKTDGYSEVIKYADALHLEFAFCKPCGSDMPIVNCTCVVCGQSVDNRPQDISDENFEIVKEVINKLKPLNLDGESMDYIVNELGFYGYFNKYKVSAL